MHRDRNPGVDTPRLGKHRAIKSIQAQHVSYSVLKDFRPLSEESRYCITFSRLRSNPIQGRGPQTTGYVHTEGHAYFLMR